MPQDQKNKLINAPFTTATRGTRDFTFDPECHDGLSFAKDRLVDAGIIHGDIVNVETMNLTFHLHVILGSGGLGLRQWMELKKERDMTQS